MPTALRGSRSLPDLLTIAAIICLSTYCVSPAPAPTFSHDVAPILQKNCQSCHRPGEAAPFPLLTYEQARPWASSMKRVVSQKIMPPWYADPASRTLRQRPLPFRGRDRPSWPGRMRARRKATRKTCRRQRLASKAGEFPSPTSSFSCPSHSRCRRPAWSNINTSSCRPDSPKTHGYRPRKRVPRTAPWCTTSSRTCASRGRTISKTRSPESSSKPRRRRQDDKNDTSALPSDFLVGYAPGQPAEILRPGQAKLIKAGSDIVLEVHYTPNGKATTDQHRVGIRPCERDRRKSAC